MAGTKVVGAGTVLLVVRGMSLKSEFRVGVTQRPVAFGQDCKAILPSPSIDGNFLGLALKSRERDILGMVDEAGHGTGRLPSDLLARLEISLPVKVEEQRRIAEILDALDIQMSCIDRQLLKLEARDLAVTAALMARVDARPSPLGLYLRDRPKNGYSPVEVDGWTGVKALGLGCLTPQGFQAVQLKDVPAGDSRNVAATLVDGDLLMTRANTRELVGLVGTYRDIGMPCIYPDLMMRLQCNSECLPGFLELILRSPDVRRQIKAHAQGTSESMVKISSSIVLGLRVSMPSRDSQREILRAVSLLGEEARQLREERQKVRATRAGVMEDLLTGRVRV